MLLIPRQQATLSGFQVSFDDGSDGAQADVQIQRLQNGEVHCTIRVSKGDSRLDASIRNLGSAAGGVTWIRVTERWIHSVTQADMEVIMGHQTPPHKDGFKIQALIQIKHLENNNNDSDDEEQEPMEIFFDIFVKLFNGKSTTFTVQSETSVKQLKLMIEKKHQIPPDQQRLLYGGRQLEDHRSLGSYDIGKNATLNMVSRLRGG